MYSTKQFLFGGMDWKRMLNMYVLFVRIIFRSTKNGGKKKERKRSLEIIDHRPTEEENFFDRFKSQAMLISRAPSRR